MVVNTVCCDTDDTRVCSDQEEDEDNESQGPHYCDAEWSIAAEF
jgi:hypothetical protein